MTMSSTNPRENDLDKIPHGYRESVLKVHVSEHGVCVQDKIKKNDIIPLETLIDWVNEIVDIRDSENVRIRLKNICR